jgi:hypothetical protein
MNWKHGVALLIAVILLSACASRPEEFPTGIFVRETVSLSGPENMVIEMKDGHFSTSSSVFGELTEGEYTIDGDQVTFVEKQQSDAAKDLCRDSNEYVYRWGYNQDLQQLTFTLDDDPCMWRGLKNTDGPWKPFTTTRETIHS